MQEDQRRLARKWQILGLSFMAMAKTPEDFMIWLNKSLVTSGMVKAGLKRFNTSEKIIIKIMEV